MYLIFIIKFFSSRKLIYNQKISLKFFLKNIDAFAKALTDFIKQSVKLIFI